MAKLGVRAEVIESQSLSPWWVLADVLGCKDNHVTVRSQQAGGLVQNGRSAFMLKIVSVTW